MTPTTRAQARDRAPVRPRRMHFDFASVKERFWFDGNGLITATLSALSATFPLGEKEFVRSVMHYRDRITDPVLREQVIGFAAQEGQHSYQHELANAWLDSMGFDASAVEESVAKNIDRHVRTAPPAVHLASTVVLEHITAILAEYMLTHEEVTASMPEPVRELLMWHAVEEIEHKAVAFDVFEAVSGDRDLLRRVGLMTTLVFLFNQVRNTSSALRSLGHRPTAKEWMEAARFYFGPEGLITKVAGPYRDFFRPDFHPWDQDNRHLVAAWKARHEGASAKRPEPS
ncbi:MAG: metal-dependent hydrolase [Sandaracinaceae bacterium]|nr:metal-dependent hydrolase [Sandaracinaceae bacterium]